MKIFVTGTKGIPYIPGGIERHCQELYPLIIAKGHEVLIGTRTYYVNKQEPHWNNVQLTHISVPHWQYTETILHTFRAIIKAKKSNVDILHIHAIGAGLMIPFARALGLKVVFTNHGPDYNRPKWNRFAKFTLRLGEYFGGKFANEIIVISTIIADIMKKRCGRETNLIYNGVPIPKKSTSTSFLDTLGIKPKKYILAVARFVPEKGLHDLLEAFKQVGPEYQLVLAGDADHETEYSVKLKKMAATDPRVILTGYITGEDLNQVFSHARLFAMPSYHEGLPIALLEAMSYDLPVLVSDIPANKEVDLTRERFFQCGNTKELSQKLSVLLEKGIPDNEIDDFRLQLSQKYNWDIIAEQTVQVYQKVLGEIT